MSGVGLIKPHYTVNISVSSLLYLIDFYQTSQSFVKSRFHFCVFKVSFLSIATRLEH